MPVTTDSCSGSSSAWRSVLSGATHIARIVWNVVATVLHVIGCPASVSSCYCCSAVIESARRSVSGVFNSQRRGSYDEVSDGAGVVGGQLNSMQTTSERTPSCSPRLGGESARYERLRSSEAIEDMEGGVEDCRVNEKDWRNSTASNGDSESNKKRITDEGVILSL